MRNTSVNNLTVIWKPRSRRVFKGVPTFTFCKLKVFGVKYVSDGKEFVELSRASENRKVRQKIYLNSKVNVPIKINKNK